MNNLKNILWGVVLVGIGVILGLNAFEITNIDIFFDGWWTLFIIVPCFISLFTDESKTGNLIGLVIGVLLLLACQDLVGFDIIWKLLLPIILIIIGLSFIFKNMIGNKISNKIKELNKKDKKEFCSTFSRQKLDYTNDEFTGCDLTAVFGGIDCDLRNAIINEDVVINITSIFGGVDIRVPKDVNVKVSSTSIFGGVDNSVKNNKDAEKTIYINATCLFGGAEIK